MMGKRFLAFALSIILCVSLLPASALAEEGTIELAAEGVIAITEEPMAEDAVLAEDAEEEIEETFAADPLASGTCGENLTWTLDDNGMLTISGTGPMDEYDLNTSPWNSQDTKITAVVIKDGVTSIGGHAFDYCIFLTSVTIPDSVTSIGKFAFYDCESLTSVVLPDNLTNIGNSAFSSCKSLTGVAIPNSVTGIENATFQNCTSLTEATIGNSVTSIGEFAFCKCENLMSITIPNSVTSIGNSAFSSCTSLTDVTIGSGVTNIANYAFHNSYNLKNITFKGSAPTFGGDIIFYEVVATAYYPESDETWTEDIRQDYGGTITWEGYIPDPSASGECGEDVIWKLDNGVLTIAGTGPMWDYSSLDVTFEDRGWNDYCDSIKTVVIQAGVTRIGGDAFSYCASLTSAIIPDSVTSIGDDAFLECSSLAEISIPDSVTSVGEYVFFNCVSLSDVVLPNSLPAIGPDMFEYCESLVSIRIPDSVTNIGELAFNGCSALEEIFVGGRLEEIGYGAFCDCDKLDRVYHTCTDEEWVKVEERLQQGGLREENLPFMTADYLHVHTPGEAVRENEVPATTSEEGSYEDVIYCTVCGEEISRTIHIIPIPACELDCTELAIPVGETGTLKVTDENGNTVEADRWNSSNDDVATVSAGKVVAKKVGKAVITATVGGTVLTCDVRVQFKDVTDPGEFYYDPIYNMVDKGVIGGFDDGTFRPTGNCNRAAVVTFLWRLAGKPEPAAMATFSDMTDNPEFNKAISWAAEQGITTGYAGNLFKPWSTCNRAAIVTFLWRYAGKPEPTSMAAFNDMTDNEDFNNAISWAAENGITTGWNDNTFRPWNTCNRLAVASFLDRYDRLPPEEIPDAASLIPDAFIDPRADWSRYDELINAIKAETDTAFRAEMMHEAEDILMATGCVIPIYYYNDIYLQKNYVSGVYSNAYGTKYFMYARMGNGSDTLRLYLGTEPYTLDPALNSSVDGACLAANSFSGLYTYNADGVTTPACATGYEVSEDGLTYTVTLREGLKWSDGSDLTAADFEYAWKRAAGDETLADYSYMFSGFEGYPNDLAVAALNEVTLQFTLTAPCAYMEDLMAFPTFYPVKQEAVEAYADWRWNPGGWCEEAGFVSNGAYVCTGWDHDVSMTYEKNPYWYDAENVTVEKLEYMLSDDGTSYNTGDLDFTDDGEDYASYDQQEVHIIDELGTYYVAFNAKSSLFEGKTPEQAAAMRLAFSLLIDRKYICEHIGQNGQVAANAFIPLGMADGNGGIFKTSATEEGYFDPYGINNDYEGTVARAVELLKSAGYKFTADGRLSPQTPIQIEYVTNYSSGHVAIAESIRQDLAVLGIEMSIGQMDWNTFLEARKAGDFDIAREGWIADFNDPINMLEMWITESGNNDCQFGR